MRTRLIHILIPALLLVSTVSCKHTKQATGEPESKKEKKSPGSGFANEAEKLYFDNTFFDASKQKVLGNYEEAVKGFQACIKINANIADVYYQLYECYAKTGAPAQLEMLEKAVDLDARNEWYLQTLGQLQAQRTKYADAAATYKKLINLNPENPKYYSECAQQYIMAGKKEEAISIYDKMENNFGPVEEAIRQKEQLYVQLGKFDRAVEEVKKLAEANPKDPNFMGLLAELYAASGKIDKALDYYNKVLALDPNNGKAHFGLADMYRQKGDSANTYKELKLAFKGKDVTPIEKINVLVSMLEYIEKDSNYRTQVLELADILVQVHNDDERAHAMQADLLFADRQFTKARDAYRRSLGINPNNFRAWQQLLACSEQVSDFSTMLADSDEALELYPDNASLYYYNANAAYRLKQYKKAAATAQAGADMAINNDYLALGLYTIAGDANYFAGNYKASDAAFDNALTIQPENVYVLNNYAYYLAERGENLEKAESMAKKALDLKPGSPSYLDTYGWVLFKQGKYKDALASVGKALEQMPGNAELLEHMGDIMYKLGDKTKAIEYWKTAKEKGSESTRLDKKIIEGKLDY